MGLRAGSEAAELAQSWLLVLESAVRGPEGGEATLVAREGHSTQSLGSRHACADDWLCGCGQVPSLRWASVSLSVIWVQERFLHSITEGIKQAMECLMLRPTGQTEYESWPSC